MRKRLTQEKFKKRVRAKGLHVKILGKYIGSQERIEVQCLVCGYIWNPRAGNLSRGRGCPKCGNKRIAKSNSLSEHQFISKINKCNSNIIVLGKYMGSHSKIKVQCKKCGYVWFPRASHLLEGEGCPKCARKRQSEKQRMTEQQFEMRLHEKNPDIKVLSKYRGSRRAIKLKCLKCGYVWQTMARYLMYGGKCPNCILKNRKFSKGQFKQRLQRINPNIKILGRYVDTQTHLKVQCLKCGYIWAPKAESLLQGQGCPCCGAKKCAREITIKPADYAKRLHRVNPHIRILGKYTKIRNRIKVQCTICGYIWEPMADSIVRGTGCPKCRGKESKGEQAVEQYLKAKHYDYQWQYSIPDCKSKRALPFDFAVFNNDGSLKALIEYQGCQHYMWRWSKLYPNREIPEVFRSVDEVHKHDMIKRSYCIRHHILLIYINHESMTYPLTKMKYIKQAVNETLDSCLDIDQSLLPWLN